MNENKSLSELRKKYPNRMLLPATSAGKEIGLEQQTTRNKINDGTFPISTKKIGGKRVVHILDLADFLEANRAGREVEHG